MSRPFGFSQRISVAAVVVVGIASAACSSPVPTVPSSPAVAASSPTGTIVLPPLSAGGCGGTLAHEGPAPEAPESLATNSWAVAAPESADIVAYFWRPAPFIRASAEGSTGDKVLWVAAKQTEDRLVLTAMREGSLDSRVTMEFRAAVGRPGQYPSSVSLPAPGCWHFALELGDVRATMALVVGDRV